MTDRKKRLRGRPPIFGKPGNYAIAYAKVDEETRNRLQREAKTRGCSVSRVLYTIVETRKPGPASKSDDVRTDRPKTRLFRVYAQLPNPMVGRLLAEAESEGSKLPRLLGSIVKSYYRQGRQSRQGGKDRAGA